MVVERPTSKFVYLAFLMLIVCGCSSQSYKYAVTCSGGEDNLAISSCTDLIKSGAFSGDVLAGYYSNRGFHELNTGRYDLAENDIKYAIKINPNDEIANFNLGNLLLKKKRWGNAVEIFNKLIFYVRGLKDEQKKSVYYSMRGAGYAGLKKYDLAIDDYNYALKIDKTDYVALTQLANAYGFEGRYVNAISDLTEAISVDPRQSTAYSLRCLWRGVEGQQLLDAKSDCDVALKIKASNSERRGLAGLYSINGFIEYKLHNYAESSNDVSDALKLDPNDGAALYVKGLIKFRGKEGGSYMPSELIEEMVN
jgi:tetratricopeptide (TPR) repeat protein